MYKTIVEAQSRWRNRGPANYIFRFPLIFMDLKGERTIIFKGKTIEDGDWNFDGE